MEEKSVERRAWAIALAAAVLFVVGSLAASPRQGPGLRHTSVLNVLFDSDWMIGSVRFVTAVAGIYVLASVLARVQRGQWLKQVGPAAVDTAVQDVAEDAEDTHAQLEAARRTISDLETKLARLLALIEEDPDTGEDQEGDDGAHA